ncbi:AAA domain-containing protein [Jiulongibacter sediminis]|uniref:DNA helicase I n=1 Tax=Jiulongibacter sediminis TaxID=1605367 RepID=A0A0P7BVE6_9BACT|nr:AAA domain-containing protein [Jiulongibacter sediminis]KPM48895.1 hypothetical protein AFM12_10080 [Jiulongibacter sediminis]TBX25424.1 hypothetical protein TK44_10085 [Jiulongibacter sediminis]
MLQLLKTYQKRLVNLTSGNRSLLLLRPFKRQFFDLHQLDFALNKPSFEIIENLLAGSKSFPLCANLDPRDGKTNELAKHLKLVNKTDKTLQEERGAEDLYVGYPMIRGKLLDGSLIRCPLTFTPVELSVENNQWHLKKRDGGIFLNRSFLLAFSHFNGLRLEEDLLEANLEELGKSPLEFLTNLYTLLKASSLEINFNSDLFQEKLSTYTALSKADFESTENGEIKLFSQAVLGIYPQTGSYISADYNYLIESGLGEAFDNLEDLLGQNTSENTRIKEENLSLPLPIDASQEEAIRQIKSGKSLVIQGPPGTGKSQLICNLMADYAASGKKVLLVCQKRAAIDTVYDRLSEVGMQPFSALIHDFKADRKGLYQKISDQIDSILAYKHENQSLNAIFLEREFDATCRKIDKLVDELHQFKTTLFDSSVYGKPVKELYLMAGHQKDKEIDLNEQFPFFHFDTLDEFLRKLDTLERYRDQLENESIASVFWQKRVEFSAFGMDELQQLKNIIQHISTLKKRLNNIGSGFSLENSNELELVSQTEELIKSANDFSHFKKSSTDQNYLSQLVSLRNEISGYQFNPLALLLQKPENKTGLVSETLEKLQSFGSRLSWNLFSKNKKEISELAEQFGYEFNKEGITKLHNNLHELIRFRGIAQQIGVNKSSPGKEEVLETIDAQIMLAELWKHFENQAPFATNYLENQQSFIAFFNELKAILKTIQTEQNQWLKLLGTEQVYDIQPENQSDLIAFLDREFENIQARDALYQSLTATEKSSYHLTSGRFEKNYALGFKRNLIIHFIEDLEKKNPILRNVSSMQMELWEKELQDLILKKRKFSKDQLLVKLREHTYKNIEKNRLGNPTTYRELKHQSTKKRQIWPVRKLVEEFSHELFDLVPCWMASPETVSAVFPMSNKPFFDLVIFDEASQCFTENGLPAMLRGKQVVIAGDNKQLQPNDLYRVRFEEENEENILTEIESLLDLSSQFLPSTTLRGHYRSKSLDLIDFSNQAFYGNKLKLLPDFKELNEGEPAIEFIKTEGVWANNQNTAEAQRVLELVRLIRAASTEKSIGVVTFNFQQAELISDTLAEYPKVQVKNIENIQGDEFDIVIFSIGYAPDESGKLKMNFGSLSQKGGENRLNVAVTRAREKVLLVSSILPEDLRIKNTSNEGPALLKEYLKYAKDVSEKRFKPSLPKIQTNGWSLLLKNEINQRFEKLTNELPFADLAEKEETHFQDLILTDDELFYSAESIKESYAYLPLTLRHKGWNYHRTWSRNWWQQLKLPSPLLEEKEATTQY